jgi:hypothetical protein
MLSCRLPLADGIGDEAEPLADNVAVGLVAVAVVAEAMVTLIRVSSRLWDVLFNSSVSDSSMTKDWSLRSRNWSKAMWLPVSRENEGYLLGKENNSN